LKLSGRGNVITHYGGGDHEEEHRRDRQTGFI